MSAMASPLIDQQGQGQDDETRKRVLQAMLVQGLSGGADQQASIPQAIQPAPVSVTQGQPIQDTADQMSAVPPTPPRSPQPDVTLAHASLADQPATEYVKQAQGALDAYQNRPLWRKMLGPGLIAAASTLGAHSRNGLQLQQEGMQAQRDLVNTGQQRYQSLVGQVGAARQLQQQEYETDQRNRQQDLITAANNQMRTLVAQTAARSRENVADIAGQSRENVADTNVGGRLGVAGVQGQTARDVANIKGGFDIQKAKINATAALNRFLAGQQREDARQTRGFAHTDLKPTADEDRRADLSQAMIEYASMMRDIAVRRPELFGPAAGRLTQARQFIGSDDPDVAELKFLKEQLGITQMGAHSLRSAQAIAPIADSLANGFNTTADALIPTIDNAIKGVSIFTGPQQRPTTYYPGGESTNVTPSRTPQNPLAPRVKAQAQPQRPPGVPAGAKWNPQGNNGKGSWVM